jgi:hypothetical protein
MPDRRMPDGPPDDRPLRDRVGGQQAIRLGGSRDRDLAREESDQLADRGQFLRQQLDLLTAERDRLSDRAEELTAQLRVVTDERDDLHIRIGVAKAVLHEGERAAGSAVNRALAALYAAGDPDGSRQEAPGRYVPGKFTAAEERSILELIAGSPAVDQLVAAAAHAARAGLEMALQAAASLLRDALSAHADGAQRQEADVTPEELAAEMFVAGAAVPGQSGSLARETWGQLGPEFPTKRRYLAMAEAAIARLRPGALTARAGTDPALPPLPPRWAPKDWAVMLGQLAGAMGALIGEYDREAASHGETADRADPGVYQGTEAGKSAIYRRCADDLRGLRAALEGGPR